MAPVNTLKPRPARHAVFEKPIDDNVFNLLVDTQAPQYILSPHGILDVSSQQY